MSGERRAKYKPVKSLVTLERFVIYNHVLAHVNVVT